MNPPSPSAGLQPDKLDSRRTRLGIVAVLALIILSLIRAFGGPGWLALPTALAALLLIAAGFPRINGKLRATSLLLSAAGLAALPFARDPISALQRGVFIAGLLLSVTSSVMLIARSAVQSHRIGFIGSCLRERQGRARYLAFTLASQFFSGILGLAGANLMFVMAAPTNEGRSETRTATVVAVGRGFAAASCWSPIFGNMAILLALYPSLHWIEVFPTGLALGQMILIVGVLMQPNRQAGEMTAGEAQAPTPTGVILRSALPLMVSLLGFLGLLIATSRLLNIIISAAIILLAPWVALLANSFMASAAPGQSRLRLGALQVWQGMQRFPNLASEALLFIAAGCAGSIMASAFPASWIAAIGGVLSGHALLGIAFLLLVILGTAVIGIHPVLSAVFLASSLTPEVLAVPPLVHMAAILAGWGLSASVTPFSVVSLTASRYAGESLYAISMGRNWRFAVVNVGVACLVLAWA
ncbi:hypothetical protein SAMN06265795_11221 [Noviherbaspirillum humi]|uniref:Uncharacterized protein n=1 Tax=Noviherbaspirillum humi TaxID=1688639 RepID=A0A239JCC0_9BURK|nr:hypothetical protein [Noviherbaspirillum humi]SNT02304.1 hypothetical protein SAMN06265795_11221 [Noviherbaspirillum humi]